MPLSLAIPSKLSGAPALLRLVASHHPCWPISDTSVTLRSGPSHSMRQGRPATRRKSSRAVRVYLLGVSTPPLLDATQTAV